MGNAIHSAIDAYWHDDEVTIEDVENWVKIRYSKQLTEMAGFDKQGNPIPKVDLDFVLSNFPPMFEAWKHEYAGMYPKPDLTESALELKISDDMMVAGTMDGYEAERGVVIDYKTCGRKPSSISESHKIQLMAYATMAKQTYEVGTIRVVYIQRPTKTLPARIHVMDHDITDDDWISAAHDIELMAETWRLVEENPQLAPLVFRPNKVAKW